MSDIVRCPYCGCDELDYLGVAEGGRYDEALCDIWQCLECEHEFEEDCVDGSENLYV